MKPHLRRAWRERYRTPPSDRTARVVLPSAATFDDPAVYSLPARSRAVIDGACEMLTRTVAKWRVHLPDGPSRDAADAAYVAAQLARRAIARDDGR